MKNRYSAGLFILLYFFFQIGLAAHAAEITIDSKMQYEYALDLFESEDYETATVEFKRFLYFFPEDEKRKTAELNVGICLYHLKKYQEASKQFNQIIETGEDEKTVQKAVLYQSRTFMMLGNPGYAQVVLHNHLKLTDDAEIKDRIYLELAQIKLFEAKNSSGARTDEALALAAQYLEQISSPDSDRISRARNAPQKNPKAAGILAVVPGAGFLYCERFHDAFITFLLNAGLMWAAYEAWDNDNRPLAGVIGFVESGFYAGNIYGSVSSAHKYNRSQIMKILGSDIGLSPTIDPVGKSLGLSLNFKF